MSKREEFKIPAVGGSMLLSIFAVLCLMIFSFLCLSTVLASKRLNDASVKAIESYYKADCEAEEIFSRLRSGEVPEGVTQEGKRYYYCCEISEEQVLNVELICEKDGWIIEKWQAVSALQ